MWIWFWAGIVIGSFWGILVLKRRKRSQKLEDEEREYVSDLMRNLKEMRKSKNASTREAVDILLSQSTFTRPVPVASGTTIVLDK